jgi:hypothetical protein
MDHLSASFNVGQGEIIDTFGGRSRQMDVVITTQDQPFRQSPNEPGLYIVEAVHAACEVKSKLTTTELEDIVAKGRSIKGLRKTRAEGSEALGKESEVSRWVLGPPPFFGFAFDSDVAPRTLVRRLSDLGEDSPVDAIFLVGSGSAINYGSGDRTMALQLSDGQNAVGWAWTGGRPTLLHLLAWLHALPTIRHGRSPFLEYLAATGLEIVLPG